jgi:hypothetical protein
VIDPNRLKPGRLYYLSGPGEATFQRTLELTVRLTLRDDVTLLLCGNRLGFYTIAYTLAREAGGRYDELLRTRCFFSRAETAAQICDTLAHMRPPHTALLITDLLARFYDEEDERHAVEMFQLCMEDIRRLKQYTPVVISAAPRPPLERLGRVLERAADEVESHPTPP